MENKNYLIGTGTIHVSQPRGFIHELLRGDHLGRFKGRITYADSLSIRYIIGDKDVAETPDLKTMRSMENFDYSVCRLGGLFGSVERSRSGTYLVAYARVLSHPFLGGMDQRKIMAGINGYNLQTILSTTFYSFGGISIHEASQLIAFERFPNPKDQHNSYDYSSNFSELCVMSMKPGSEPQVVYRTSKPYTCQCPSWDLTGQRLFFTIACVPTECDQHKFGPHPGDIFVLDLSSGAASPLIQGDFHNSWPAQSPDGRWLAYRASKVVHKGSYRDIHLYDFATGAIRPLRIPLSLHYDRLAWSPDCDAIAFCAGDVEPDIYITRIDGSGLQQITDIEDAWSPSWSVS